jgi:hypothetical protein
MRSTTDAIVEEGLDAVIGCVDIVGDLVEQVEDLVQSGCARTGAPVWGQWRFGVARMRGRSWRLGGRRV